MRGLGLWSDEVPAVARLASSMPFCYDTLAFPEWLQWVLLPRLKGMPAFPPQLPYKSNIAPFAEEWFRAEGMLRDARKLQGIIRELDQLLSNSLA